MFPTLMKSSKDLAAALTESKVQSTADSKGLEYMKFSAKDKTWTFGKDKTEITNEEIIINVGSIGHGWMLFPDKGEPQKIFVPFTEQLPPALDKVDSNDPAEARCFQARFVDDAHTILAFQSNSYGARAGVDALLKAVTVRAMTGETEYLHPVVKLSHDAGYQHAKGYYYNPVFVIVGYVNDRGEVETEVAEIEAPKIKRRSKA